MSVCYDSVLRKQDNANPRLKVNRRISISFYTNVFFSAFESRAPVVVLDYSKSYEEQRAKQHNLKILS